MIDTSDTAGDERRSRPNDATVLGEERDDHARRSAQIIASLQQSRARAMAAVANLAPGRKLSPGEQAATVAAELAIFRNVDARLREPISDPPQAPYTITVDDVLKRMKQIADEC